MEVTVCGIPLTLLKKNNQWGVYLRGTSDAFWMRWTGEEWCFLSEDIPTELKAIKETISLYIRMKDE